MRIVIKVIIRIKNEKYKIKALVNSDIEANYMKKKLALDINILLILKVTFLALLKEKRIYLYRDYIFRIITENILRNYKEANIYFILYNFNLNYINIILEFL
jgi:hypothetical protein